MCSNVGSTVKVSSPEMLWSSGMVLPMARRRRSGIAVLALDLHGTDFQLRVWAALRRIPAGERRSYREVAESIGEPTASRAVARACATNKVAVVVPCHRVVRGDGALSGYKWGVERKQRLLDAESSRSDSSRDD